MPRFNHRRRSSRRKPPVPRAEAERRLRRRRVQGIFQGWGRPTPPTVREVQRIVAKSNVSRLQSAQRQKQKESTAASFRARKARRLRRWQVGREDFGGRVVSKPMVITHASTGQRRGPPTSLTPAVAAVITDRLAAGDSIRGIARDLGIPRSTVGHWVRTGRVQGGTGLE